MSYDFSVSDVIPATPLQIFEAWLDSEGHAGITGGQPANVSDDIGGRFTVWNGYITGRNLALEPGKRIVQSWRTTKFTPADPDSEIEVVLEEVPGGTLVTVNHRNVPDGHTSYRDGGWQRSYFDTMKAYFGDRAKPRAKPKPRSAAKPKPRAKPKAKAKPKPKAKAKRKRR
jgi:activator of HSP90 ATPase